MSRTTSIWLLLGLPVLLSRCKDPYVSPYKPPPTGYLVVEGYISGNTTTQFTLSRTIPLPGDSTIPTVDGASVQIEGSDNSTYPLQDIGNGIYSSVDTLILNPQLQYRLRIQTSGDQYLSDFVPFKPTPPIDSVNFVNSSSGVNIYVNTHDPSNNTRYYQWDYTQIYEHDAAYASLYYYDQDTTPPMVLDRSAMQEIYRCWTTTNSSNLIIGSSIKLAQDEIYEQPLTMIPPNDIQLSVLYTILVRQYALSQGGYAFLQLMQQNTESLGSIFDAQPSQITGNIHSLTNPTEEIIGYVSAGTVQQQRLWISRSQVPSYYAFSCPVKDDTIPNDAMALHINFGSNIYTPIDGIACGDARCWLANYTTCLDCRMQGGVTQKPSFWPN